MITSIIMKKAHANTKIMKLQFPEINYGTQLGLEIKKLLNDEKINRIKILVRNKLHTEIIKLVPKNQTIFGQGLEKVENMLLRETRLKRLYFPRAMQPWELSNYLVENHFDKVRCI